MRRLRFAGLVALGAASIACASAPRTSPDIDREAREFMAGYARDLLAGDRAAIAARYDARGAYMAGGGEQRLAPLDSIRATYQSASWNAPARFDWRGLTYEVVGPDAVLVSGRFEWTTGAGQTLPASYTALLVRRDGRLRIRAEHEDVAPSAIRDRLCAR
jgi:hypothetical protein